MLRIAIVGIGNPEKVDDGAGVLIAEELKKRLEPYCWIKVYQTGTTPENYLVPITEYRPRIIYLIDACDFGGKPGDFKIFSAKDIKDSGWSTHAPSLSLLIKFLSTQTQAKIFLLAIQPGRIGTRKGPSLPLKNHWKEAVAFLAEECTKNLERNQESGH